MKFFIVTALYVEMLTAALSQKKKKEEKKKKNGAEGAVLGQTVLAQI